MSEPWHPIREHCRDTSLRSVGPSVSRDSVGQGARRGHPQASPLLQSIARGAPPVPTRNPRLVLPVSGLRNIVRSTALAGGQIVMSDTMWSVLSGIVAGLLSGTISARVAVNRMSQRLSGGSQLASDSGMVQRDGGVQVRDQGQYARGANAKNVGRDENRYK